MEQITGQRNSTCGQVTDGQKRQRSASVKQAGNGARARLREEVLCTGAGQMSQEMRLH